MTCSLDASIVDRLKSIISRVYMQAFDLSWQTLEISAALSDACSYLFEKWFM